MSLTPEDQSLLDDHDAPVDVEGFTKRRVELVARAAAQWMRQLVDLGGRNNLLNYRDLRLGTLELTDASPRAVASLLQSKAVRVSALFPDPEERGQVLRRLRTIHNKARENFEERGLETLSLACGLATWQNARGSWEPCAPVLLRQATLRPLGAAQDEFELALVDEMEVNPTLLHLLKADFDCDVQPESLLDRVDGVIDEAWELEAAYQWLREHSGRVSGFAIVPRLVLTNFAYAKLPMVRDLEGAFDELVANDLIAAIAGDEDAREAVRAAGPGVDAVPRLDAVPPADEFLVLDADASQNYAINAVVGGQSLIIKGPPGTGKSQTIANLIASLVARQKRVLFVAEKRAAIEAVTKRLAEQELSGLVLDLHGGVGSRRAFAQAIGSALASARMTPRVDFSAEQAKLQRHRKRLNDHAEAVHGIREPWGRSVYDLRAELIGLRDQGATAIRIRGAELNRLDQDAVAALEQELSDYARLDGLTLTPSASAWVGADIASEHDVRRGYDLVDALARDSLPRVVGAITDAAEEAGLPAPETINSLAGYLALWADVGSTLEQFSSEVFEVELDTLCVAMAPARAGGIARIKASLFSGDYKTARSQLRGLVGRGLQRPNDATLGEEADRARDRRAQWRSLGGVTTPTSADVDGLRPPFDRLVRDLELLEKILRRDDLLDMPIQSLVALLESLVSDRGILVRLPDLHRLETRFAAAGFAPLLAELKSQQVTEGAAISSFRYVVAQSTLDAIALSDRLVEGFSPQAHNRTVADYTAADRDHIETTAARIRRICAEHATQVRDQRRDEAEIVHYQANLKRRHMPVRDLVKNTAEVLLALKPCWAMSPLVVSQILPPTRHFDVVIFDEASQVTPADAIPSILRGAQLVVAGDEHQLPPTSFFVSESPEDEAELEAEEPVPIVAGTSGFESILDALGSLLSFRWLRWHYRSRDERLIAFSNAHIYDGLLTTFPGARGGDVLRTVHVPHEPGDEPNSPSAEVNAVVDLIFEHARTRPDESLGVIAMGIKHANRIEECRRQRLQDDPELASELGDFFDETREERFFVKNLERVQGDERDAIILSVGYGKNDRGQVVYRFGPLLQEGGERRLNVAITRAKARLTLVASFTSHDLDPERSQAPGVQLLRQYLQYVESGGTNLGDAVIDKPALNPFEVDVRDTLARHGLSLTAQYGASGYYIDYAVRHPTQPGRYVLAIECDGASYHSSESARDRDRLRQDQLERLGWRFHRIWSSQWFHDKDSALKAVLAAYEAAVGQADHDGRPATAAVGPPAALRLDQPATTKRVGRRPAIPAHNSIADIPHSTLVQFIRWIESDDQLRTEDELLEEAMRELGGRRRGGRVVTALTGAIKEARSQRR